MSASEREALSKVLTGVKALNPAQAAEIETIFRSWPVELQKLLASVDGVEFVRGMKGAGEVVSRGGKTIIAINADWFDKGLSASEYKWRSKSPPANMWFIRLWSGPGRG